MDTAAPDARHSQELPAAHGVQDEIERARKSLKVVHSSHEGISNVSNNFHNIIKKVARTKTTPEVSAITISLAPSTIEHSGYTMHYSMSIPWSGQLIFELPECPIPKIQHDMDAKILSGLNRIINH